MQKNLRKSILTLAMVLLALILSACNSASSSPSSKIESNGFNTPEEAVKEYFEGMKEGNTQRMIGAFAIESYVKNYDFEAAINRIRAYQVTQEIKFPNTSSSTTSLNVESRRSSIGNGVLIQFLFLADSEADYTRPIKLENESEVKDFVVDFSASLDAIKLDSLKLLGFIPPEKLSDHYSIEKNQENIAKQAKIAGPSKLESRAAIVEINSEKYLFCCDVGEYNGKWYLINFSGNIGNLLGISTFSSGILPLNIEESIDGNSLEALMIPAK